MVNFANLKNKAPAMQAEVESFTTESLVEETSTYLDAEAWYTRACQFVEHAFHQVSNEEVLDIRQGENLVAEIVQAYRQGSLPGELVSLSLHADHTDSFLVINMVNVTLYAIMVGGTLGLPEQRLSELGLAALLHDIGKIRISEKILYKEGPLTQEEVQALRDYPYESFEILRTLADEKQYLAETALQVNERVSGNGYPQGLKGETIHPYAQIIGLMDVYEDLTHTRPYRQKLSHFEAVKEILNSQKRFFRRNLLKALLETFSLFPLNSYVKLNSGAIGKVVQTYPAQPLRPKIQMVRDAQRRRVLTPRTMELKEQALLHILDAVPEVDLPM